MVREALCERALLERLAPAMVEPMEFHLAVRPGDGRPRWKVRAGLALYDILAGGTARPRWLADGVAYRDARCLPERLALATVLDAVRAGAVAENYVEVVRIVVGSGRVRGAVVRDAETGEEAEVMFEIVVNAAGPWAERVAALAGLDAPLIRPVRGAHVVVRGLPLDRAVAATARDGRLVFAIPWGETTCIGTTEVEHPGDPAEAVATPEEVAYLLGEARRLFPRADLDVVHTYAGVRNLVAARGPARAVSREARIVRHAGARGLATLVGGKLSTHRAIAERIVDAIARDAGNRTPCATRDRALPPPPFDPRTPDVALAARLAREERVRRLGDLVFRRTWLGFLPSTTRREIEAAADALGDALGWDAGRRRREVAEVEAEAARIFGRTYAA